MVISGYEHVPVYENTSHRFVGGEEKDVSDQICISSIYTVQGQGLAPIGLGSTRPDPNRARVRPDFWCLGPALMGSRAKESDLA